MKKLKIIKEDFDSLEDFVFQYTQPNDCPIARALKRMGKENPNVAVLNASWMDKKMTVEIHFNGRHAVLMRIANELKEGAKLGVILIT